MAEPHVRFRLQRLLPVVVLWLAGCAAMPVAETPVTGPRFRILSYNVNWGCPSPEAAIAAIREADADLVCLQETNATWERHLRRELTSAYAHMTFHHAPAAGGMAILSKQPFRDMHYGRPTSGWFAAWVVAAETPIGPVQVVNVHLRPPLRDDGGFSAGTYLSTQKVRHEEMQEIFTHVDAKRPAVVAGDFNEGDGGRAVAFLRGRGFTDALRQFDRGARTWEWGAGSSPLKLTGRLDHVMASEHLRPLAARVIRAGASDHYPVVATVVTR